MINTHGKLLALLFSAFIVIILGIAFIQPIADDVNRVSTSSYPVTNETLNFVDVTTLISNETVTLSGVGASTGTLANDNLTAIYELRNETSEIITTFCNVTLSSGALVCNATGSTTAYTNYTYVSGKIETLNYDDLTAFSALRNVTSENIIGFCNVTSSTGALVCNNTYSTIGYADYTYESDTDYIRSSTTRTLLIITILFFAIGVLAVGIGFTIKSFQEGKLM